MKNIKAYFTFTKNSLERNLSYKANAIMFFLGDMVILSVTYYLWKAVYSSSSETILNGFSYNNMIVYVILSFVTQSVISTDVASTISREVMSGSISSNLIKPISYEKRMLFEGLGNVLYNFLLVFIAGFIAVIIVTISNGESLKIINVLLYFVSIILSYFINFFYSYALGLLTFKITNMWGVVQIMSAITSLFSGALIPISFFPGWSQRIFNLFPFKSIIYTPCMIFQGKLNGIEIIRSLGLQALWVIIMAFIGRIMYKALIKNLTILGG